MESFLVLHKINENKFKIIIQYKIFKTKIYKLCYIVQVSKIEKCLLLWGIICIDCMHI